MTELLALLREGRAWSAEDLAAQLGTTPEDIRRQMEFLEHAGFLRRISSCGHECKGCSAHCGMAGIQDRIPIFWELAKQSAH